MNNKNYQYYNNRNAYGNICIPRREEILNYLIKEKFLSEFKTNEEKQQVLYNLGILQIIDNLLDQINTKADIQQLQNYVTLQQFLDKVKELDPHDEKSKGYYSSIEQLIQEYPTGEKGDWAIVNINGSWYIYRYDDIQGWVQSGTYDISIDLTGYVTKEELYNIQNPLKLNLSISNDLLEYTGNPYTIRITAQAKKGNNNVNADSYQIYFNSIIGGFNKTYETQISNKGITTFNVTCTLGEETVTEKIQVNLVLPTYIGFYNSSDYNEVNISSLTKKIKDSISMTETIENTVSGSYLWIITPLNLNLVATDPGFTYRVKTILVGTANGFNYYRSNSAIDVSNLTYYIK